MCGIFSPIYLFFKKSFEKNHFYIFSVINNEESIPQKYKYKIQIQIILFYIKLKRIKH